MASGERRSRPRGNDLVFSNPAANFDDDPDAQADLGLGQAKYVKYVDQHTIDDSNAYVVQNTHPMDSFEEPKPQPRPRPRSKVNETGDQFPYSDPGYRQTSPPPMHHNSRPTQRPQQPQEHNRSHGTERLPQPAPQEVRSNRYNRADVNIQPHIKPSQNRQSQGRQSQPSTPESRHSRSLEQRSTAELNIADSSAIASQVEEARKATKMPCGFCSDSAYLQYWMDWLLGILFVIFLCAACAAAQQWALMAAVLLICIARALVGWALRTRLFWKKQPIKPPTTATVKVALLFILAFLCLCGYGAMVFLAVDNAI